MQDETTAESGSAELKPTTVVVTRTATEEATFTVMAPAFGAIQACNDRSVALARLAIAAGVPFAPGKTTLEATWSEAPASGPPLHPDIRTLPEDPEQVGQEVEVEPDDTEVDDLCARLRAAGVVRLEVPYYGSSDEGTIGEATVGNDAAGDLVDFEALTSDPNLLQDVHEFVTVQLPGGWEDNEGGVGAVIFRPDHTPRVVFDHGYYEAVVKTALFHFR